MLKLNHSLVTDLAFCLLILLAALMIASSRGGVQVMSDEQTAQAMH